MTPTPPIRLVVLDDHQGILDGYQFRLDPHPDIHLAGTATNGAELEALFENADPDVLLLDMSVPTSPENPNPYPVLHAVPRMLEAHPGLEILVISMIADRPLIRAMVDAGVNGYVLKDDMAAYQNLAEIIRSVAAGGIYFSPLVTERLRSTRGDAEPVLTPRQQEALSLCAAYPNWTTADLAARMGVTHSTARNLLSGAYLRLDVRNRAAAIARARQLGLIPSPPAFG